MMEGFLADHPHHGDATCLMNLLIQNDDLEELKWNFKMTAFFLHFCCKNWDLVGPLAESYKANCNNVLEVSSKPTEVNWSPATEEIFELYYQAYINPCVRTKADRNYAPMWLLMKLTEDNATISYLQQKQKKGEGQLVNWRQFIYKKKEIANRREAKKARKARDLDKDLKEQLDAIARHNKAEDKKRCDKLNEQRKEYRSRIKDILKRLEAVRENASEEGDDPDVAQALFLSGLDQVSQVRGKEGQEKKGGGRGGGGTNSRWYCHRRHT